MKGEGYTMKNLMKVKCVLEDIAELDRRVRVGKEAEKTLKNREETLKIAINEYLKTTKKDREIRKYDKVAVIADHEFKGEIGHVVEISPDYEFPYLLEFMNRETQRKNADSLLWKAEELEIL